MQTKEKTAGCNKDATPTGLKLAVTYLVVIWKHPDAKDQNRDTPPFNRQKERGQIARDVKDRPRNSSTYERSAQSSGPPMSSTKGWGPYLAANEKPSQHTCEYQGHRHALSNWAFWKEKHHRRESDNGQHDEQIEHQQGQRAVCVTVGPLINEPVPPTHMFESHLIHGDAAQA